MASSDEPHPRLYLITAGLGALVFFLGPTLALVFDVAPLPAATVGYAGIMFFTGGVAARYDFARGRSALSQLGKNLLVAAAVTVMFYLVFLLLFFL